MIANEAGLECCNSLSGEQNKVPPLLLASWRLACELFAVGSCFSNLFLLECVLASCFLDDVSNHFKEYL